MNLLKSFLILITVCFIPLFGFSQSDKNDSDKRKRLEYLISKDSIYEVTLLLNEDIAYAKSNNLPIPLAKTNQILGHIFSQIESHETAAPYYLNAYHIYDSLNKKEEVDMVLTNLSRNYVEANNYKKFDSIIPIALAHSQELNSINFFYNLESIVRKNYFVKDYDIALDNIEDALELLEKFEFLTDQEKKEESRLIEFFKYYKALSMINSHQYDEGYSLLFKVDPNQFRIKGYEHNFPSSHIGTLNYYKYRYFNERTQQLDSATKYLLKSNTLKYTALKNLEDRLAQNGKLIYKIINTEKQLQLANDKRKQDKALSNAFILATIILALLLTGSSIFFYYYYTNRKHIKQINLKLKASNRKLKVVDKERLEFFSILSHELRTPIYGINGLATLIEQEQCPDKRKGYLSALISSSHYISVLIDNVLQISKLKFENKSLHLKPTNISQLIKKVSSSIKISAEQKGLELHSNIEKKNQNESLLMDNVVLSQILINLAYNAIRYTSKGFISIDVTEQNRTATHVNLLFKIRDSGIGIQRKHKDIIFNAFENKTFLEKNSSGSGLGLYIVKTLLKSYNAEIEFTSTPNEGSTFYFDIDFEIAKVIEGPNQLNDTIYETPTKILVVDDNTINLMITQKNVEKISGCFSETATHGREAICLIKEKDFDLVLMDINMPDMDGYEATKHIRLFNPDIPILALTALNSAEIQEKAEACGMNQVITKPYDFEEFKSIILKFSAVLQD